MDEILIHLITTTATQFPVVVSIFAIIGVLRTINKPLFALIKTLVKATPSLADDEILVRVEMSPAYKAITFFLDWTLSIKLPPKTEVVKAAPAPEEKPAA